MSKQSLVRAWVGAAALAGSLAAPSTAGAQVIHRFTLRAELGAGTMLSDYQRNTDAQQFGGNAMGFDNLSFVGTARLGFSLVDSLAVQVSFANWFFPSTTQDGVGRVMAFQGGLRFEPRLGRVGRIFVDGNVGYALTGPLDRLELDAGVGFEFALSPAVGLGPVVRFADVLQPNVTLANATTYPFDAVYWTAGLSLALRIPEPAPPPPPPPPPQELTDTDCDRVPDRDDLCPTVPQGDRPDPQRLGCPIPDSDNDGVLDPEDQCPRVSAGDYPDEARRGCPDPDLDHDGVANAQDQCVNIPAGPTPDNDRPGCPNPRPLAFIERDQIRITRQVHFDTNRWSIETSDPVLSRENHEVLDDVVSILRFHSAIQRLEVQGHTDDRCVACPGGPRRYNFTLSENRAQAIQQYLVEHGVDPARLTARGYGQSRPVQPNTTEAGRQANRRVQFQILEANWPSPPPPPTPVQPHPLPPLSPLPPLPPHPCHVQQPAPGGSR